MLNTEIWKTVAEFPNYEVSNLGRVRNKLTLKILSTFDLPKGYEVVSFHEGRISYKRLVHRVVAEAFLEKPEGCDVVNHLDFNRKNNKADNLEWTTQKSNIRHSKYAGRMPYNKPTLGVKLKPRGENSKSTKYLGICWIASRGKWVARVVKDGKIYGQKRFDCEIEAAKYRDEVVKANNLNLPLNFS